MGDFCVTCGLTHLPILAGDPTVAVILRRPLGRLDIGSVNETLFAPVDFPSEFITVVKGLYDNYGRIEGAGLPESSGRMRCFSGRSPGTRPWLMSAGTGPRWAPRPTWTLDRRAG